MLIPRRPFHSSFRVVSSALLLPILVASGDVLAAPVTEVAGENASDKGLIFEVVEDGTAVRLKRILDADPDAWKARNGAGNQPLHLAAEAGKNVLVSLLLEHGADVTARGSGGWSPLHYAAEEGHPETCRILLKAGARRGALCDFNNKAIDYARDDNTRLALKSDRVLVQGVEDFLKAAGDGDLETVQTMLKNTPKLLDARGSQGKTAVMKAATLNRVGLLKWLIEAGADINLMTEEEDVTALYLATENGHVEVVKLLLDHEVEVNPSPTNESEQRATVSPLSQATFVIVFAEEGARGDSAMKGGDSAREIAKDTVEDAADMNASRGGFMDIEEPLRSRKTEIAKLLIAAGAKPYIKGRGVPLVGASIGRQLEIVRLLLEAGADPNRRMAGMTPLEGSLLAQAPKAQIQLLLEKGADPVLDLKGGTPQALGRGEEPNSRGRDSELSALGLAVMMDDVESFRVMFETLDTGKLTDKQKTELLKTVVKHPDFLKIVLTADCDVNLEDEKGRTALHYAAFKHDPEAVSALLEAGADVKARDDAGYTPLHYAAKVGNTVNVERLLAKDAAQLESLTDAGTTPLIVACAGGGNVETVAFLVKKGANMEATFGPHKMTALMYCALWGRADFAEYLIRGGADVEVTSNDHSLLSTAAGCSSFHPVLVAKKGATRSQPGSEGDYLRIAGLLIEYGADVNQAGDGKGKGALPLSKAVYAGSVMMVKLLLKHGADANITNKNDHGRNPLWNAIHAGEMELFGLILEELDNVDAKDSAQSTALHFAAAEDQPEMVKALVKKGARINEREKNGATPLMMAVYRNAGKAARALLEAGADRTISDSAGNTPMQLAEHLRNKEMINLLITARKK